MPSYLISSSIKFSKLSDLNISFFKKYLLVNYNNFFYSSSFLTLFKKSFPYYTFIPQISVFFLPLKKKSITILRSPHVYKKTKEKYSLLSYSCVLSVKFKNYLSDFFVFFNNLYFIKNYFYWFSIPNYLKFFILYHNKYIF